MARLAFSIIIPFEFHRGLSEQCVQAWVDQEDIARTDFQIVIAAPMEHDPQEIESVQALLAPHDKLLRLPYTHDMPLLAEAIPKAEGDTYFFTEAHCLPAPDCLSQASKFLLKNPDIAGFSGRSIPATRNLLSEIEAEMYTNDIDENLSSDSWLKALDQCLVVRKEAYEASGGVEAEYGHFAEWILAARFHLKGLKLNYCPEVSIQHFYCGDLEELVDFTVDFAEGKIRFIALGEQDAATKLFPAVRTLQKYQPHLGPNFNPRAKIFWIRIKLFYLCLKTKLALALKQKEWARDCFKKCIGRAVTLGYMQGLKRL
ncbi:MAG: hypothetical protein ACSHX8_09750 [Opitutaceae bacterium]